MYNADENIVAARRAAVEAAIRDIRRTLPPPPWSARSHTDLGVDVRPEFDWQLKRVEVALRLHEVGRRIEFARQSENVAGALRILDAVEEELRDLGANALPELQAAIEAHDRAAKRQLELEELREGCRRDRDRWARLVGVLGFVARARRDAKDEEIRELDERLRPAAEA